MRNLLLMIIGLWLGSSAAGLNAGWLTAAKRDFYRSHQRSQCWPNPYNLMDQQVNLSILTIFNISMLDLYTANKAVENRRQRN